MRSLFILPLLLIPLTSSQNKNPVVTQGAPQLTVVSHKCYKARQVPDRFNDPDPPPAQSVFLPGGKNPQRQQRVNETGGARDPAADTTDGRAAALERMVQESRKPDRKPIDGFSYKLKVKNESAKPIDVVFWEYQFIDAANPQLVARRQFLCGLNLKPGKDKDVLVFSLSGPSEVVSAGSLASNINKPPQERVLINRVEYADGSIWQRRDWNFAEIRLTYARAMASPWTEMCRGL